MTAPRRRALVERIKQGAANAIERHATGAAPCLADRFLLDLNRLPEQEALALLDEWIADKTMPLRREIACQIAGRES